MKKILSIGEALIDVIKQDGKIIEENVGGAPLNVACSVGYLGGDVSFVGAIGNDSNGKKIEEMLSKYKVDLKNVQVLEDRNTSLAYVSIYDEGERNFEFKLDADQKLSFKPIEDEFGNYDIVHLGSATSLLSDEVKKNYKEILKRAVEEKMFISFDPNWRNLLWKEDKETFKKEVEPFLKAAHLVKLSEEELQIVSEISDNKLGLEKIMKLYPQAAFIITLGSNGSLFGYQGVTKHYEIQKSQNPVDTTGAGDSFIAYIVYKISQLDNFSSWIEHKDDIVNDANLFARNSIEYKGALSFLEHL
ncbi:fructokinase [Spiroplasma chinense]|uniref:Fructokinase n=1 Tax=Spiroplasma chinense TaxID=216932 RepID=A0A5B9Y586_9MOLU|nr:carbohydrate kinase [Spiroplasma chinense]QEH62264.1 fructokinase [Spiroplasma chinense]